VRNSISSKKGIGMYTESYMLNTDARRSGPNKADRKINTTCPVHCEKLSVPKKDVGYGKPKQIHNIK